MDNNHKKILLLVEDEILIALVKQKELERYGYNVLTVNTGEKAKENERQLEYERVLSILNAIPDGVYIVNKLFEIEYINPAIEEQFGTEPFIDPFIFVIMCRMWKYFYIRCLK